MTAELTIKSPYGDGTNLTLPTSSGGQLSIMLTDLPTPSTYQLYVNGNMAQYGAWNSGIAYELNIPLTNLTAGTYTFKAIIAFAGVSGQPDSTTNTATLTVVTPDAFPSVVASNNIIHGTTAPPETTTPSISLTMPEKVGIGVGVAGLIGIPIIAYLLKNKTWS